MEKKKSPEVKAVRIVNESGWRVVSMKVQEVNAKILSVAEA